MTSQGKIDSRGTATAVSPVELNSRPFQDIESVPMQWEEVRITYLSQASMR
jgi:hypothetical protein